MFGPPLPLLRRASRGVVALGLAASALALVPATPVSAASTMPSAGGSTFTFDGGGFGHGVGMSQYGARGQADAGRSAAQILGSYYPGTSLVTQSPPGPKVLLAPGSCSGIAAATSTTLQPVGGRIEIWLEKGPSYATRVGITSVQSGETASVSITGDPTNYYRITSNELGSPYTYPGTTAQDRLVVVLFGVPTQLGMTGIRYSRGELVLDDNAETGSAGYLNAYAQGMSMDEYLYGLSEVPSSWPTETLKSQAIAGRSYAERVAAPRRAAGSTFHIFGSVSDQCYRGYEKEGEGSGYGAKWVAAVSATTGQVLTYGGSLAQTFYSSSNGGHSERSGYVFVTDYPYLPANPDPYDNATGNSLHRWRRTFDGDDLGNRIGGVGRVTDLAVSGSIGASGRLNKASIRVTGTLGAKTITGSTLRSALGLPDTLIFMIGRDCTTLYGSGTPCPNNLPVGGFDSAQLSPSGALIQGWAVDPDAASSIEVHAYVNGSFAGWGYASGARPDVAAVYPQYGGNRGFSFSVPVPIGTSSVCAYAIDANYPGLNRGLGCRSVTRHGVPFGNYEAITRVPGGGRVQGWVIDPDTPSAVEVHVYAGGRLVGYGWANKPRGDVGAAYPGYGDNHGFIIDTALPAGSHAVCAYAINVGGGTNPSLGCRTITISPNPIGNLDTVARSGGTATAYGWTLDPDVTSSTEVHVYVDGQFAGWGYASLRRSDIGAAYPAYGSDHGFALSVPVAAGSHQVCAYAINAGPGWANPLLGCRSV